MKMLNRHENRLQTKNAHHAREKERQNERPAREESPPCSSTCARYPPLLPGAPVIVQRQRGTAREKNPSRTVSGANGRNEAKIAAPNGVGQIKSGHRNWERVEQDAPPA